MNKHSYLAIMHNLVSQLATKTLTALQQYFARVGYSVVSNPGQISKNVMLIQLVKHSYLYDRDEKKIVLVIVYNDS